MLPVAGRYSLHASFVFIGATTSPFDTSVYHIGCKINGVVKEVVSCAVNYLTPPEGTILPGINECTVGGAKLATPVFFLNNLT